MAEPNVRPSDWGKSVWIELLNLVNQPSESMS